MPAVSRTLEKINTSPARRIFCASACLPTPKEACENECLRLEDCGQINDTDACQSECGERTAAVEADAACSVCFLEVVIFG